MHPEYKKTEYIIVIVDYKSLEQTCRYIELFEQACENFTCVQFILLTIGMAVIGKIKE